MPFFSSSREKRLWLWALVVVMAIYSTLFIGRPLARFFGDQNIQAIIFVLGLLLVAMAIITHGLLIKKSVIELALWLGIAAVYIMLFLRLGIPERSHLIEYSVLAIIIHKALMERQNHGTPILKPAMVAALIAFFIGALDECIQIFLPNRVFDPQDILFNGLAIALAIGSALAINWLRERIGKSR